MTIQRIPARRPARRRRRRLRLALVGGFAICVAIVACIPAATRSSGDLTGARSPPAG